MGPHKSLWTSSTGAVVTLLPFGKLFLASFPSWQVSQV
jgi:hypothetical protein